MLAKHVCRLYVAPRSVSELRCQLQPSSRIRVIRKLPAFRRHLDAGKLKGLYQPVTSSRRHYTLSFQDRLNMRASKPKAVDNYADRDRGDLSEYANKIHGLSAMTGGRDLEVLRAWNRNNFDEVLDICDDIIEGNRYEVGDDLSSLWQNPESSVTDTKGTQQAELYLFHRNVKAAALNQLQKWTDAVRVADETIKITGGRDRDALCLKGAALNALGTSENSQQRNEESLKCFTAALEMLTPGNYDMEATLNQATLLFKLGRHNEAEIALRTALNLLDVKTLVDTSDASESPAIRKLDLALSADPFGSDEPPQMDPIAIRQVALDREHIKYDPDLRMLLTAIFLATKRLEEALAECKLGIAALKRKSALGSHLLSRFYEIQFATLSQLGRFAEAELVAKMLTKIHPYSLDHLDQYVSAMVRQRRPFEEIWRILKAFAPNVAHDGKEYSKLLSLMLATSQSYGNADESIRICTELLKLGPDEVAFQVKALHLLKKGRALEALQVCDQSVSSGHGSQAIHLAKALAFEALQDWENAEAEYETVILKDPKYSPAHYHIGKSLARRGRNEEALLAFDRSLGLEGGPIPQVLLAKATLLKEMGKLKDALDVYQQLAKINPDIGRQLPYLAESWKKGNPREFMSPDALAKIEGLHHLQRSSKPGSVGNLFGGFKP